GRGRRRRNRPVRRDRHDAAAGGLIGFTAKTRRREGGITMKTRVIPIPALFGAIVVAMLATAGAQTGGKKKAASKPVKLAAKAAAAKPQSDPKAEALLSEVVAGSKAVGSLTAT